MNYLRNIYEQHAPYWLLMGQIALGGWLFWLTVSLFVKGVLP